MKLVAKPWNWDKATLAFRKHHEQGQPRRYRRASLRQLKKAQQVLENEMSDRRISLLSRTLYLIVAQDIGSHCDELYYGHS